MAGLGLLAAGRWREAQTAPPHDADSVAAISAGWNAGAAVDDVVARARTLLERHPDDVDVRHLFAWLQCAAGNHATGLALAVPDGERSPRLRALALGIALATGAQVPDPIPGDLPCELSAGIGVNTLLESRRYSEAVTRARAAAEDSDAGWVAWTVRAIAESKAGDWRAALSSALRGHQMEPRAAEPVMLLRHVSRLALVPLRSAGLFVAGLGFFAVGAANDEETPRALTGLLNGIAGVGLAAGGVILLAQWQRAQSLSEEVRGAIPNALRFRYREALLMFALAGGLVLVLLPRPSQLGAGVIALVAAFLLVLGLRDLLRSPIELRRLLSWCLTGLVIRQGSRPYGGRQAWWRGARGTAPSAAGDASVDLSN